MGENSSRYEEFFNDQEVYKSLVDSLKELVPKSDVEKAGDTIKFLDEAAFVNTLLNMARRAYTSLSKNEKFKNVQSSGRGSSYTVTAELVEPVSGIGKVEFHFNKDIS